MPKITIAIPTYNRQAYLKACIESILNQTFQDFKILIFDNGSEYDLPKFLGQFEDKRIFWEISDKNTGGAGNFRSIFLHQFDTPYVVVFHDDDVMHTSMLETEFRIMENNKEVVWTGSDLNFVSDFSRMEKFSNRMIGHNFKIMSVEELARNLLSGFNLSYASVMYRTEILESIEPFQKEFSKWGDRPFMLTLAKKGKIALIYDKLVNYRIHPGQDSSAKTDLESTIEYSKNLFKFYLSLLPKPLSKSDKKLFYSSTSNNILRFAVSAAGTLKDFQHIISNFQKEQLFFFRNVSVKGLYSLLKAFGKKLYL